MPRNEYNEAIFPSLLLFHDGGHDLHDLNDLEVNKSKMTCGHIPPSFLCILGQEITVIIKKFGENGPKTGFLTSISVTSIGGQMTSDLIFANFCAYIM